MSLKYSHPSLVASAALNCWAENTGSSMSRPQHCFLKTSHSSLITGSDLTYIRNLMFSNLTLAVIEFIPPNQGYDK